MSGKGFPYDASKTFSITLCGNVVTIVSVSNTEIKFVTPACSTATAQDVGMNYNSKTVIKTDGFTYTDNSLNAP